MKPLLSRVRGERLSRRANKYEEFKDPYDPSNNMKGSSNRRYGGARVHDDGAYPLTSTSGSIGATTNTISSGRVAGPNSEGKDSDVEDFSLEELEAQRTRDAKRPADRIKVKKEWKVQRDGMI